MTQSVAHWRTPALVVTAGCLIALLTFGVRAGFGLFLEPMSQDLGWGREVFAFAIAVQNLLWGLGQPFAGALADRYGSGRVLALGGLLYGLGVWLMAHAASPWELQLSAGVLVGLGLAGASFAIALAAMSRAVPEHKRSWVLGIGTAAGSLGQFLMVPLGQAFLGAYGWSTALVLLACGVLMVIPLAGVLQGRVDEGKSSPSAATVDQTLGEALREAGGHGGYWYLTSGFFVCGFHVAFIATHLPAYLVDNGIAPATAAWALALVGLFNVIGSYSAGILGGRYSKKYLLSSLYLTRAVAIAAFVLIPLSTLSVWMFAAAIGLLWLSTVPLASGLVAQIFGTRYMATLFGIVFLSHQAGAFLGVWLGGYLFDSTGSYGLVWWISVALGVIAAILHWPIDERRVARLAGAV
jgi:MFS family permease